MITTRIGAYAVSIRRHPVRVGGERPARGRPPDPEAGPARRKPHAGHLDATPKYVAIRTLSRVTWAARGFSTATWCPSRESSRHRRRVLFREADRPRRVRLANCVQTGTGVLVLTYGSA